MTPDLLLLSFALIAPAPPEVAVSSGSQEAAAPVETADPVETAQPVETAEPGETVAPVETVQPGETAEPSETVEPGRAEATASEVGSDARAPLAPAAPALVLGPDPGPWRGRVWLGLDLTLTGGVGGETAARTQVVAVGGGGEIGVRITNWIGIAWAFSRHIQEVVDLDHESNGNQVTTRYWGYLSNFDFALVRLYMPWARRFQPWVDVGGGLVLREPALSRVSQAGGQMRLSLGFDVWLAKRLTLRGSTTYRLNVIEKNVGHDMRGAIGLGVHW